MSALGTAVQRYREASARVDAAWALVVLGFESERWDKAEHDPDYAAYLGTLAELKAATDALENAAKEGPAMSATDVDLLVEAWVTAQAPATTSEAQRLVRLEQLRAKNARRRLRANLPTGSRDTTLRTC